jgi:hypothetical protein
MDNARKSPSFGKGHKVKGVANKGLATKLAPNQPNAMEAWFAHGGMICMFGGVGDENGN